MSYVLAILKADLKSLKNYFFEKKGRILEIIIITLIFLGYVTFLFYVLDPRILPEMLGGNANGNIFNLIVLLTSTVYFFSYFAGMSIVTTVRTGFRREIIFLLTAPTKPVTIFALKFLEQALILSSFFLMFIYPVIIWLTLAIQVHTLNILVFSINFIIGLFTFSVAGEVTALFTIRLSKKMRILLSTILMIGSLSIYWLAFSRFNTVISGLSVVLSNNYSPLRWIASPIVDWKKIETWSFRTVIVDLVMLTATYKMISLSTNKFLEGKFRPVEEKIKVEMVVKRGILNKLFNKQFASLVRKEILIIKRSPDLLMTLISVLIAPVIIILVFTITSNDLYSSFIYLLPLMGLFTGISTISITSTLLAYEKKNLALLFSAPIKPRDILVSKLTISLLPSSLLYIMITIYMLASGVINRLGFFKVVSFLLILATYIILSASFGMYIAAKYTNFKAKNPRKALKGTGQLFLFLYIYLTMGIFSGAFILFFMFNINPYITLMSICIIFILLIFISKHIAKAAYNAIERIESLEYL